MKKLRKCKGKMCIGSCWNCKYSDSWGHNIQNPRNYWCRIKDREVEPSDSCDNWDN